MPVGTTGGTPELSTKRRPRRVDALIKWLFGDVPSRFVLFGAFAALLLSTVGITTWLLVQNGSRGTQAVLVEVASRVDRDVHEKMTHFLGIPDQINRYTSHAILSGRVDLSATDAMHRLFWDAPREGTSIVSAVYLGSIGGSFVGLDSTGATWPPTSWRYTAASRSTGGLRVYLPTDEHGHVSGQPRVSTDYDPRVRPWFIRAAASDGPVWTDIYANFGDGVPTLTRAVALHDDRGVMVGVAGVDLFLEHLQGFLHELDLGTSGEVFVIEGDGTLIGSHAAGDPEEDRTGPMRPIEASDQRFTRAAGVYLADGEGGYFAPEGGRREQVVLDGARGWLSLTPIGREQGLDWSIGVFVPERDYLQPLSTQLRRVLPLALLTLFIALVAFRAFAELVVKPLRQLRNGASRISVGEFDVPIDTSCGNEVGDLARAIDAMRLRLRESFDELVAEKSELAHQASHDAMTGLVNRREFERRLILAIEEARHRPDERVLCYIDVDRFKLVNDGSGHEAGDELLRRLGDLLRSAVREGDTVGRLGGDEFGVLLENCTLTRAADVVESIRERVEHFRFSWGERAYGTGISAGLVAIGPDAGSAVAVLRDADSACYIAKQAGRNRLHVHREDDEALVRLRGERSWVERVERALEDDRFSLRAQRIESADDIGEGSHRHVEILLRLVDESGDVRSPAEFLPAAERYGLGARIDRWVVARTLEWLASPPPEESRPDLCSINLSGQSLGDETTLAFVVETIGRTGVSPASLCFEVTETATIANLSSALALIDTLRELGCAFALDDFGSGLSSFAYLKTLPVDYLKIDGMFVRDMLDDPLDRAMVRSINEVGQTMGMRTIAEYVENDAIRRALREIGVDYVQGYGIGRPEPLETLAFAAVALPPAAGAGG